MLVESCAGDPKEGHETPAAEIIVGELIQRAKYSIAQLGI